MRSEEKLPRCAGHIGSLLVLVTATAILHAAPVTQESVRAETLKPYTGASVQGVDTSTLSNKVLCGYQGWFNAEGDGAERGWVHWTKRRGPPGPGNAKIDLWPDVSELSAEERFTTGFTNAAGRALEVFSSFKQATVLRHFQWMRDYGIDGTFVQRFINDLRDPHALRHNNTVLAHCREGANRFGRAYAVMYDLSGLGANRIQEVMDDWRALRTQMHVADDAAYLHHRGLPLVAVWGVGFNDGRRYTLGECKRLVEFLKQDGCSVMLGVPAGFRDLTRDSVTNTALHEVIQLADVVSPWTVGRYRGSGEAKRHGETTWQPDMEWCDERKVDFLPVVFPGFSWFNMFGKQFDLMPRMKGEFLWSQFVAAKRAGATMIYVAMFDEVDEGTAIFKCANEVPIGGPTNKFLTYEGLPGDFYLRLTGSGGKLLRDELPLTDAMPVAARNAFPAYQRPVMTWVPPYAVGPSKARLEQSDLEGNGSFEADREAFVAFIRTLSGRVHAAGKHLTVDTFSYKWNAPNQTWWPDLLPHVDALTTMGYEETGSKALEWRGYTAQKTAAGEHTGKLMIGLPSGRDAWRGNNALEHLQWLQADGRVGVSFWDAQVKGASWQKPEVWQALGHIRGRQ